MSGGVQCCLSISRVAEALADVDEEGSDVAVVLGAGLNEGHVLSICQALGRGCSDVARTQVILSADLQCVDSSAQRLCTWLGYQPVAQVPACPSDMTLKQGSDHGACCSR